jgi:hypothetical protein
VIWMGPFWGGATQHRGLSPGAYLPTIRNWSFSGRSRDLPRWRARASRSEDGPVGRSVMVVSGSIRSPDEADALSVELSIADTEIIMSADGTELGSWPAAAVDIRRIDSTGFEFVAEGDRLVFTPDDPATFGDNPIVGGHGAGAGSRRGRKSKKKSDDAEPRLAWYQDSPGEERRPRLRAVQESPNEGPRKAPRRRKATAESTGSEAAPRDIEPAPPSAATGPIDATLEAEQPAIDVASTNGRRWRKSRREPPVTGPEIDDALSEELRKTSNGVWIRVLDVARKYDAFGLDRVPIDQGLRGQEHQHTWDHRVVASSGLGRHICTICGETRRKAD